ncbi:hypothetical protein [Streptomyces sp. UNOB3_S3]|uniref:hypothetical protein n=1 Tax=Streptomyces sp. UNOB3_S3 TaxID=2871682 RepID=UPI001E2FB1CF|nr:hypothetical protein [Streptomyces sp. UNOB3_S3]MCC3773271.1 hypothetical protein [Streptomyces sp. UNOB3_S3]
MTGLTLGVRKETVPGERRVALVPESVPSAEALGLAVVVESGAGAAIRRSDDRRFRRGQVLIALLAPLRIPFLVRDWADAGVTSIGLDLAPETSVLARPMDAVASQGRLAGYKAALLAADRLDRPLAGTAVGAPGPARCATVNCGSTWTIPSRTP